MDSSLLNTSPTKHLTLSLSIGTARERERERECNAVILSPKGKKVTFCIECRRESVIYSNILPQISLYPTLFFYDDIILYNDTSDPMHILISDDLSGQETFLSSF